jgi:hypothetical protein
MIKTNKLKMTFVCDSPGLTSIPECLPQPMQKFVPNWWKNIPYSFESDSSEYKDSPAVHNIPTVKACPSYPDYFSQGYVLPMWCDTILKYDEDTKTWGVKVSDPSFSWEIHTSKQFTYYKKPIYQGNTASIIFKTISPWKIITPPGVSILQLPVFYEFNSDFSVLPGIIKTDIFHQANHTVLFHSSKKEIYIERGTPFVHYIPFVREKSKMNFREITNKDQKRFEKIHRTIKTKFIGNKQYLNLANQKVKEK